MRQPDIEIYLRDANQEAVGEWLAEAIGPAPPGSRKARPSSATPPGFQ